ncbi:hypothetical protein GMA3_100 [Gordonia phage GMA3]|uniref:Zinc finger CHC2-type domain-containing protein n=1 Tax=Gordonia phage GMA3 TaxID=1647284 RepID=A0A0K0NL50_9CAUD|nr:helicase [Gordonia phage GMA3]AKL88277.1 hypothetical protein GMA3_100 [Gordonia phage GMA3]
MSQPDNPNRLVALTPLRPSGAPTPEKAAQSATDAPAALAGGTNLARFTGIASEKDGAKEELKALDLLRVFQRLFPGKTVTNTKSNSETLVSCFNSSGHSNGDRNPSMSINNSKNTYTCFGCETSGDILDMVAYKQGYADSLQRCPSEQVHQAVYDASSLLGLGWEFHEVDGKYYRGPARNSSNNILHLPAGMVSDEPVVQLPIPEPEIENLRPLDWRNLLENDTAPRAYMEIVTTDDVAEEYHFWNIMVLVGLMLGRNATFRDGTPVQANLFVCLNGPTSAGKSRSMGYVKRLIASDELKFDPDDAFSDGVKVIHGPGSGEALTRAFQHESPDPAQQNLTPLIPGQPKPKRQPIQMISHPVRGFVQYEEMTTIVKKASSETSTIKPMMIELYDGGLSIGGETVSQGSHVAEKPFGSILTSIQPGVLESLFGGTDDGISGFLNRWLFIPGVHKKSRPLTEYVDVDPVIPYLVEIRDWAEDLHRQGGMMEFAYATELDRFTAFYESKLRDIRDTNGLQRIDLVYKKLILLGCAIYHEDHITERALEFAEYLIEWLIESNKFQKVEKLDSTKSKRMMERIKEILLKSGQKGIAVSQLAQRATKPKEFNEDDFRSAYAYMIKHQIAVEPQDEVGKKFAFDGHIYFANREKIIKEYKK